MKLIELIELAKKELSDIYAPREISILFFRLAEKILQTSKIQVLINQSIEITQNQQENFLEAIARLKKHEPIEYIIGHTYFLDNLIYVNRNVLIPRPETEEMIVFLKNYFNEKSISPKNILDIGTGSGCIAIALKRIYPDAFVKAIDISPEAIEIARQNAQTNNVSIDFICKDFFDYVEENTQEYSIIVSNPPYVLDSEKPQISERVKNYEPRIALFIDRNKMFNFYSRIIEFARHHLSNEGICIVEINERFGQEIRNIFMQANIFQKVMIKKDFFNKDRFVIGIKTPNE